MNGLELYMLKDLSRDLKESAQSFKFWEGTDTKYTGTAYAEGLEDAAKQLDVLIKVFEGKENV